MACVLLKQYIKYHWRPEDESVILVNDETRLKIKNVLPMGLADPYPKIQNSVAHSLALIAHYEYPHNWVELTELISKKIKCNNYNEVIGVLLFLSECSKLLPPHVMGLMTSSLYNDLYIIFQNEMVSTCFSLIIKFFNLF